MLVLLGFGMFFELYDLLVHRLCRAEPGQVRRADGEDRRPLRHDGGRELHRRPVRRPLHRHDPVRLPRRPFTAAGRSSPGRFSGTPPPTSWWRCRATPSASTSGGSSRGVGLGLEMVTIGAYVSELAPKGLRGRAFAVNQAIGFACVPVISFLAYRARARGAARDRGLALGGADRRARRAGRRVPAPRPARKPALARQARPARRGGPRALERDRSEGRGRIRQAAAAARPGRAGRAGEPLHRPLGPGRARPGDPDERLQHLPDDRLLRLLELGPLAPRQAGDHRLDQPRLYDGHRARRAGRAADRLFPRRPVRAQMDHRRRGRRASSSAGSSSARRGRRRSSSPWASR